MISENDEALKAAAKVEYAKLKKTQADYKAHNKEMQKRMASKLFNAQQKAQGLQQDGEKQEEELSRDAENTAIDNSERKFAEEVIQGPATVALEPAPTEKVDTKAKSKITSKSDAKHTDEHHQSQTQEQQVPKPPSNDNSVLILVGTSLVVVLVSLVVAYLNQN